MSELQLFQALIKGKKVRNKCWPKNDYVMLNDWGELIDYVGNKHNTLTFTGRDDWEIYKPCQKVAQYICRKKGKKKWSLYPGIVNVEDAKTVFAGMDYKILFGPVKVEQ